MRSWSGNNDRRVCGVPRNLSNSIVRSEYLEQRERQEERAEKETHEDPNGKKGGEESQEREQGVWSITPALMRERGTLPKVVKFQIRPDPLAK